MRIAHWKDLLIAILFAYLVIDLLASYVTGYRHFGTFTVFAELANPVNRMKALGVIALGAALGYGVYWYFKKHCCLKQKHDHADDGDDDLFYHGDDISELRNPNFVY